MPLYQSSVLKQHITLQDKDLVDKAYKKYTKYFLSPTIQDNIRSSKEEEYQGIFLTELFVNILDYTLKPNANFNLVAEYKNQNNARKADGAILNNDVAIAVIELKGTNTKDLESIRKQAFDYKANQKGCVYVVTSNFEKLRFYINDATEFEEFNLFQLSPERFALLYLCLQKENIINNVPLKIKEASVVEEEQITKQFYKDYSLFKRELYRDLVKRNAKTLKNQASLRAETKQLLEELSEDEKAEQLKLEKNVKLTLFKKSQKLIDRYLFIFFAEDRGLLPPNSTQQILDKWHDDVDFGDDRPLYTLFKQYFNFLDQGRAGTAKRAEIYAYNGGLFKEDKTLDSLEIDSHLLYKHTSKLAAYDFESQVDVNILGHIFENSLNEIESVNAEIEGADFDKQKSKRKKDGVFYTPKYITKYIVENTIGKLCNEKKTQLGFKEEEYFKGRKIKGKNRPEATIKKLVNILDDYRNWLLQLTICDPACGSGAFLNQALDFLIKEHTYIDELKTKVLGGGFQFPDIENTILENNIYGVDLNEESIEIAKLSLWLRTAQPRRKLNDLSSNIKCGNSLIDSKAVAGDKAFNWQEQFPKVFKKTDKKIYHVTTAIHDSRTSKRMEKYKVRERRDMGTNPYPNVIYFTPEDDFLISKTIASIVKEDDLKVLAYNICADHIHLLLACDLEEIPAIMQKIKGRTSFERNKFYKENYKGLKPLAEDKEAKNKPLWQQKYSAPKEVTTTQQLYNTITYIQTNRAKHELPEHNSDVQNIIDTLTCTEEEAFKTEHKGGFDVVIGNPPYVRQELFKEIKPYLEKNYKCYNSVADLYTYFIEKGIKLMNEKGLFSFILPNKFLKATYGKNIRIVMKEDANLELLLDFDDYPVFTDATTYPIIYVLNKNPNYKAKTFLYSEINKRENTNDPITILKSKMFEIYNSSLESNGVWNFISKNEFELFEKLHKHKNLADYVNNKVFLGIKTGKNEAFIIDENTKNKIKTENENATKLIKKVATGKEVYRYRLVDSDKYMLFTQYDIDIPNKFPSIHNWLKTFEKDLQKRGDKGKNWWNLRPCDYYKEIQNPKIIWRSITNECGFYLDRKGDLLLTNNNYFIANSTKGLIALLNSKVSFFILKNICTSLQGGFYDFRRDKVMTLPIPNTIIENESSFESEVNRILDFNESKTRLNDKFQNYLTQKFQLEKLSKKLQNWHELEFGEFIKELNKAIKANNKLRVKKGLEEVPVLTKKDEFEWLDLFEDNKQKAQALQTQINQTDKEIDQMVYELYGLTDDEIQIVENS
ncbi:Eco57I restriction-modification methylase domain-containing protein [Algibacter pectinivorans]|uniref:site-specific DNA-methyltransferase (adenine-specific) n=1 Tax=Algibacter pectinivorans TaxID=870482 RepID=A0A1I1QU65_9FLAO|nr:Eco57I restriction-modification methylase domain-containing protein [Algibacter pectinivorans]SFD25565.1 REP element-mobilizing transposase RayT [Algibacter pectinivorans]